VDASTKICTGAEGYRSIELSRDGLTCGVLLEAVAETADDLKPRP